MSNIALSTFMCVDPGAVDRAQRLEDAVRMLRNQTPENEVRRRVKTHHKCSRATAWRTVEMAKDIA